jgi:hypothetical protein
MAVHHAFENFATNLGTSLRGIKRCAKTLNLLRAPGTVRPPPLTSICSFQSLGLSFLRELDSSVHEAVRLDCMGDLSSRWCTDFLAQREIWMFWKLRRPRPGKPC